MCKFHINLLGGVLGGLSYANLYNLYTTSNASSTIKSGDIVRQTTDSE